MRLWTWLVPALAIALLPVALAVGVGAWLAALCAAALIGAVGLTVTVVVLASLAMDLPLVMGLEPKDIALLALSLLVSAVTLAGRTSMMQGAVHLVLFATFLFLAFVP